MSCNLKINRVLNGLLVTHQIDNTLPGREIIPCTVNLSLHLFSYMQKKSIL